MGTLVLDTNVVIAHLEGKLAARFGEDDICVSVITEIELLGFSGLDPDSSHAIREFLSLVRCITIDNDIKERAILLRQSTRLRLPDAIIAATAIVMDAQLLTHDAQLLKVPGLPASAPALK